MVCGIIWANRVAPRGVKTAKGWEKLAIVTKKMTYKKKKQIDNNPVKLSLLKVSHLLKSRIGKQ